MTLFKVLFGAGFLLMAMSSCNSEKEKKQTTQPKAPNKGTLGFDQAFLEDWDSDLITLHGEGGEAMVLVSAKYQGKVFTSSAEGPQGRSYGWVNYDAFDGPVDKHMNAYGGENRFWLGPEGGPYSLYFAPDKEMVFENWFTPASIDTESWNIVNKDQTSVALSKETQLQNYQGHQLDIKIDRKISLLSQEEIGELADESLRDTNVKAVGYLTENNIKNVGDTAWTAETGAPCIWILDMFRPSPATTVVIPYDQSAKSKVATTDYFGEISEDRILHKDGVLYFKADGKSRGKLGLAPDRATEVAGSYDAENSVLTITRFDLDKEGIYLNQEWKPDVDALKGDAVNAYNDGPLEDGSQMGPFYEIESVSPAAFLAPGERLGHRHWVYHFSGEEAGLDRIAKKVLGVDLETIKTAIE
ncbi:DUF6786 family protein [Echinicola rosea]|uniref:Lipoprotein n=1 Tax=Echinicola rosea TaxID=1807691 RepID=A0ABQ1UUG5_9BACT|nr:DUF6786 family protein [Echinicola rosea]GGF25382.1 hypothetical protein GCM10011339_11860 [Echinicola rosea]